MPVLNGDPYPLSLTKSELTNRLAEANPHLMHKHVEDVVSTVLEEITCALEAGHRVELRGFGAFSVKRRDPRLGRNPRTGESVDVGEKYVPFFKPGKQLRERLNKGQTQEKSPARQRIAG